MTHLTASRGAWLVDSAEFRTGVDGTIDTRARSRLHALPTYPTLASLDAATRSWRKLPNGGNAGRKPDRQGMPGERPPAREWAIAIVLTLLTVSPHRFPDARRRAGRDEVNTAEFAQMPSLHEIYASLQYDGFPPLAALLLPVGLGPIERRRPKPQCSAAVGTHSWEHSG
jgi:hypothetical protein